jgi:hypothetical protein
MPYSSLDSWHPEDLWKWMDAQRKAGNELLAISHNANLSDGWMYCIDVDRSGRPLDAAWAESRMRNERLVEIKQIKGQSETHPLLSPTDELASYEITSGLLGLGPTVGRIDRIQGGYGRQALKDGITMQDVRGYNPYKFGMAGGSDSHNTGSHYRHDNFYGGHAQIDGTVERRMAGVLAFGTWTCGWKTPVDSPECGPRRTPVPPSGMRCTARRRRTSEPRLTAPQGTLDHRPGARPQSDISIRSRVFLQHGVRKVGLGSQVFQTR